MLADELWKGWESFSAGRGHRATVAELSRQSGVKAETLRVLFTPVAGASRSGPGFITVARVAMVIGTDLAELVRSVVKDVG